MANLQDFEVLIIDDRSQDSAAEAANWFRDPQLKHIRNDRNLGNLRNYNKGISLSRGKNAWLVPQMTTWGDDIRVVANQVSFPAKHGIGQPAHRFNISYETDTSRGVVQ